MTSSADLARAGALTRWLSWRARAFKILALLPPIIREHRFSRFILVGGVNTAVGYCLFLGALATMPTTFTALVAAYILAILFNFMSTGTLVFGVRDARRLPRFLAVYGFVFAYNAIGLELLEAIAIKPWLGGLILQPGAIVMSYLLNRRFVFGGHA